MYLLGIYHDSEVGLRSVRRSKERLYPQQQDVVVLLAGCDVWGLGNRGWLAGKVYEDGKVSAGRLRVINEESACLFAQCELEIS